MEPETFSILSEVVFTLLTVSGAAAWLGAVPVVQKVIKYLPLIKKVMDVTGGNVFAAKNKD